MFKSLTAVRSYGLHSSDNCFIKPYFHEQVCLQGDSFLGVGSKHLRMFSETQQRLSKSSDHTRLSLIQAQGSTVHFSGALQNCEK
jgi:hypothetical protein